MSILELVENADFYRRVISRSEEYCRLMEISGEALEYLEKNEIVLEVRRGLTVIRFRSTHVCGYKYGDMSWRYLLCASTVWKSDKHCGGGTSAISGISESLHTQVVKHFTQWRGLRMVPESIEGGSLTYKIAKRIAQEQNHVEGLTEMAQLHSDEYGEALGWSKETLSKRDVKTAHVAVVDLGKHVVRLFVCNTWMGKDDWTYLIQARSKTLPLLRHGGGTSELTVAYEPSHRKIIEAIQRGAHRMTNEEYPH